MKVDAVGYEVVLEWPQLDALLLQRRRRQIGMADLTFHKLRYGLMAGS